MHQNSISRRNKELTEIRECLVSFGAESFVVDFAIQRYTELHFCLLFCMGVKLGHSH